MTLNNLIERHKKLLNDKIEIYRDVYSQPDNEGTLAGKEVNKNGALYSLKKAYNFSLRILEKLNVDVSEFPKKLEEFIK